MKKCFLSIETSLSRISLVLYFKEKLYSVSISMERSIEVEINQMLSKILKKGDARFIDISCILVSLGPGSYTGTRVGLAAAKAIAISINRPLFGFTNFEAIYNQGLIEGLIKKNSSSVIIIKANKNECYYQEIDNNIYSNIGILKIDSIKKNKFITKSLIGICSDLSKFKGYHDCKPEKEAIFKVYKNNYKCISSLKKQELEPLYIKGHYAEK